MGHLISYTGCRIGQWREGEGKNLSTVINHANDPSRGGLYYFLSGRRIVGEFMDSEGKWNRAGEARVIKGIIKRWDLQKSRRYISIQKFSPSFSLIEIHILFKKNM